MELRLDVLEQRADFPENPAPVKTEIAMGRHGHHDRGYRNTYGRSDDRDPMMTGGPVDCNASPSRLRMAVVLVGLALWSLLALIGYALVDPVLGWIAISAGLLEDGGKSLATAAGVGKEVGNFVDGLNVSGLSGQVIALLRVIARPAIIVFWAIGALTLIAAPVILPRLGRLLGARRH
ncbi:MULTISPECIES: hypothetical protein [Halomonadaceae]|uniref:Uncharacterized protein n=1 Tax=Modicisalibacter zincidurans TaxID=1178777 RepID=A0ABP9QXD4_9GAMM|nr:MULTISPECIES: hypothetical protein [Halomonas]MCD6008858.1 hypothetical protein [Halomonas sp. IOP_31]